MNLSVLLLFFLLGLLPCTIVYDHNSSRRFRGRPVAARIFLFFLRRAASIRIVHPHLKGLYNKWGLERVTVESPFIPPDISSRAEILKSYPVSVLSFLNDDTHYKVATAASKYNLDGAGNDIYGISSLLELIADIRGEGFRVRWLFAFGEFNVNDFPPDTLSKLRDLQRQGDLIVMDGQREFWPVYESIDMFLRLTSTDGESVSILEAIHFGCRVLASDVVPRPSGVVSYQYGDHYDLKAKFLVSSGLLKSHQGSWKDVHGS